MLGTIVGVFAVFAIVLGIVAFLIYQRILRRAKSIERGLKMVPIRIHLEPREQVTSEADPQSQLRAKIAQAETLYSLIAGSATKGFKSNFYGQRHLSLEIVAADGSIQFYAAVPVALVPVVEQAIVSAYPSAKLEQVEDYNIFSETGRIAGTAGGELVLKEPASYPIQTFNELERDPLEALLNTLSSLANGEGAGVQVLIRPADKSWTKQSNKLAGDKRKSPQAAPSMKITPQDIAKAAVKGAPDKAEVPAVPPSMTGIDEAKIQAVEEKAKYPGFETLIRLVAASENSARSQAILTQMVTSFALYDAPGRNGFKLIPAGNIEGLVTAFIFRFFPPELHGNVLNSVELATLFHLPEATATPTAQVERQQSREVDGPQALPTEGLLLGYNLFRGNRKEVRLDTNDRRRHSYIVGQTGTGKSTMLENLAVQDMLSGNGFAFIDPHGDAAERLLGMVPKARAEDIIYFNPGDTSHPLGLNLFEFQSPEQKDFLVQESLNMLYKLYDPGKTGIIGPRFEQWFRNAALTLMADPAGSTLIEIPKVFTDAEYLKQKFKYLNDQTVIEFWTKEMAQTSDFHKSEMLGWFVSKFGAFASNEIMRNIIGQTKSAFDLRDIMDNKKILIVNLSKGLVGELNSQLLGMMFVIKFQAAAMSRANMAEEQRADFCLYVDEFQNFSTDSFATILSEARKYRLNLIVANQFIGQLSEDVRNAVFGNVGSIISFRTGPEDADFLVKQFQPVFNVGDLTGVPNGHAVVRLMVGGLPSQPFSLTALPPLSIHNPELGEAVKQLSAAKFGVSKEQVEADITARMQTRSPAASTPAPVQTPPPPPVVAQPAPKPAAVPQVQPQPPAQPQSVPQPAPVAQGPQQTPAQPVPTKEPAMAPSPQPQPSTVPTPTPLPAAEPQVLVPVPLQPTPEPLTPATIQAPPPIQPPASIPVPVAQPATSAPAQPQSPSPVQPSSSDILDIKPKLPVAPQPAPVQSTTAPQVQPAPQPLPPQPAAQSTPANQVVVDRHGNLTQV